MRSLVPLERARERNARLWDGTAGTGAITVPSEIRNAATLDDARRLAGMNPHLPHREDVRAAFVAGREQREASDVAPKETTMAKKRGPTETQTTPTPEKLRTHLLLNGPTTRDELREAVGYAAHYPSEAVARTMLNKHLRELGAVSPQGRLGPVELPGAAAETQPAPDPEVALTLRRKPFTGAPDTVPVRPSLARAAREAIREANESDAPVYLEPAFAKALHGMLVEAGL